MRSPARAVDGIDEAILTEAATWLMEMHEGPLDAARRRKLAQWRQRSPEHERAWSRAALLQETFAALPPGASNALKQVGPTGRRKTIKLLAYALTLGPAGWLAFHALSGPQQGARIETAIGERREVQLDDGSRLWLNTDTRITLDFTPAQRLLRLQRGEIMVLTAPDRQQPPRPFLVATRQGSLRPLGTRFTVRERDQAVEVAVLQGAVEITPASSAQKTVLPSGMQTRFTRSGSAAPRPCDETQAAWSRGLLIAERMPLAQFIGELGRYRSGLLQADPAIAGLEVSGVFPLADTDRVLRLLAQTLPVRVQQLTRYWVRVLPATPAG